jgi:ribosomal protein S18 acetylase RimI-like enzyme
MGITIRKAIPEDAYDYTVCLISCWQSAYKGIVPDEFLNNMLTEKEQRFERYKKNLADPGECEYYCVMYSERMIGFLIINKSLKEDKSNIGEIWAIYLIEEFRGKGYGEEVLNFAVNELTRTEPKEIFLWVFEENNRARHFYEKHNFSHDGTKREVKYGKPLVLLKYVFNPVK